MSAYVMIVGLLLVAAVVFLLRRWKGNPKLESLFIREKPDRPREQTHRGEPVPKEYPVTIYKDGVPMKGWAKEMPQGLQVFDENGNIVVDVTDRLTKILGSFETHGKDGSITDDRLEGMDYWVMLEFYRIGKTSFDYGWPLITRLGNTISWAYPETYQTWINRRYIYGVM